MPKAIPVLPTWVMEKTGRTLISAPSGSQARITILENWSRTRIEKRSVTNAGTGSDPGRQSGDNLSAARAERGMVRVRTDVGPVPPAAFAFGGRRLLNLK